jgi:hypothetical protein
MLRFTSESAGWGDPPVLGEAVGGGDVEDHEAAEGHLRSVGAVAVAAFADGHREREEVLGRQVGEGQVVGERLEPRVPITWRWASLGSVGTVTSKIWRRTPVK